jgi:DNA-binding MarR family transcriptional regulator
MDATENLRLKKLIRWLIGQGIASSQDELAQKLGYTRSSFSLIVNEKVKLSPKFINRLCMLDHRINRHWVMTGEGEMILEDKNLKMEGGLFDQGGENHKENEKNLQLLVNALNEKERELEGQKILVSMLTEKVQDLTRKVQNQDEVIRHLTKGDDKTKLFKI